MGLHLHRAERADRLADGLARVLAEAPADPFAPEVVAVPARGVERWLTGRLAHRLGETGTGDGVAANIAFPAPARLIGDVVAAVTGLERDDDAWTRGLSWRLLGVVDACAAEAWIAPLARHLEHTSGRRLAVVQRLAGLFTAYGEQRPQLLRDWAGGHDTDGAGAPLDDDLRWQAELWRRLRAAVAAPSPAERLDGVCARLRDVPAVVGLPDRLSLFGATRLSTDQVAVLGALAAHRDVHLWLPSPSAVLWDRVAMLAEAPRPRRRLDPGVRAAAHPLLSSLGRDAREMQVLLARSADVDEHLPAGEPPATVLGRLQHDLHRDRAPDATHRWTPGDRSLQVHACHGRARQVEVLREVLLGLLAADPTLEPRDVLVMCPDIEAYAPLISATFGLGDDAPAHGDATARGPHPGHRLRVRLADRSLRQTNPLLGTLARLLDLADGRVTASQVLDLAAYPPVRRRFRLDDADLERLREWAGTAGVRWGLDAEHRSAFRLESVTQNTWRAGLDRVLVGVAMAEDEQRWLDLALPLDVDSGAIDLAGRVAELVDRLGRVLATLAREQPLSDWLDALDDALGALTSVPDADAWQLNQARRELGEAARGADRAGDVRIGLADARVLLSDRLRGRPTRAGFRTGNLTMCSMVPMRSVPHRVICLLGLDDGFFPRTPGRDGDDVLLRDAVVGEQDRRSEDRQLLLDAVLAAEEHLVLLYTGADERTNAVRPPAVPLGEILDAVDATVRTPDGRPAREHLVVRHPLQPFDARNFTSGTLGVDGPFSFDPAALAGARAAAEVRRERSPFLRSPLTDPTPASGGPDGPSTPVELAMLVRFLEHPVRGFLRQRLGVWTPEPEEQVDDAMRPELAPLERWAVGDRWVRARLDGGAEAAGAEQVEWRRGTLPPGALGVSTLAAVEAKAEPLVAAGAAVREGEGEATVLDVVVTLPGGRVVTGSVAGVHGRTLCRTVYSRLAAKHRIRAWVQLLALSAAHEDVAWRGVTVGGAGTARVARSLMSAPAPDRARALLATLVDLNDRGLREPLPLPLGTSLAYAEVRVVGDSEDEALRRAAAAWTKGFEAEDPDHRMVWGPEPSFAAIRGTRACPADQPDGTEERETTRFGALACRLWFPVLGAETMEVT